MADIIKDISTFIRSEELLNKTDDKVLVALSGGADSVFLALALMRLGYDVHAAHCNFHLRGEESMRDEAFVRNFCLGHGIGLHTTDFDTKDYAAEKHQSLELAARNLRYEWFADLCRKHGYTAVCVGHHRDDNVETVLLNLVRGTGIQGLCGMEPTTWNEQWGIRIVRPLLHTCHADIETWLTDNRETWVVDSTNLEDKAMRNKVRLNILPMLSAINPAAAANIERSIENMREARKVYDAAMDEDVRLCSNMKDSANGFVLTIDRERLAGCSSPLSVLHEILSPIGFNSIQIKNMLTAKGYRCNRTKGENVIRLPHSDRYVNVSISWKEIVVREIRN